jgi:DNA polymerase-3 subunit gamma/tau
MSAVDVRRLWPDVVNKLSQLRKATWTLVSHNAQVMGLEGDVLTIGFATQGLREQFARGNHEPPLKQAITDVIGADWRIEAIVDQGVTPGGAAPGGGHGAAAPQQAAPQQPPPQPAQQQAPAEPPGPPEPPGWADAPPEPPPARAEDQYGARHEAPPPWDEPAGPTATAEQPPAPPAYEASRAAREAIQPTRMGGAPDTSAEQDRAADLAARDADVRPDDSPFEEEQLGGAELLQRELGAQIIEEIRHQ